VAASGVRGHFSQGSGGGSLMSYPRARTSAGEAYDWERPTESIAAPQVTLRVPRAKSPAQLRREKKAEALRAALPERTPKHVQHCYGTGSRLWWIYTWRKSAPESKVRVPYMCQSWRCPHCRKHESHVLYSRMLQATEPLAREGFLLAVLTVDRDGYDGHAPWVSADAAYKALSRQTRNFLKRLRRWQVQMGMEPLKNQWLATVEAHRSGWPHVNLVVWSPELAAYVREHRQRADKRSACGGCGVQGCGECREATLLWGPLLDHAMSSGWGRISTLEAVREGNTERVCGYIVKLAGMHEQSAGEVSKLTQLPTCAPERFRRLRSGKGFLPPRYKDDRYTGTLVRRFIERDGTCTVQPLQAVAPERAPDVERCCAHEETLAHQEFAAWAKRQELIRPPVVHFRGPVEVPEWFLAALSSGLSLTAASELRSLWSTDSADL
jgi:hypothetical protein